MLRRDLEERKEMLMPEVSASKEKRKAVDGGREESARGEVKAWSEVRKEILK